MLSLPVEARWLYVSILLSADDVGLFEATPFRLARRADVQRNHADKLLAMLADADLVRLYEVDGKRYGFIPRYGQRLQIKRCRHPHPDMALLHGDEDAINKIKHLASNPTVEFRDPPRSTVGQPPEPEPEPEEKQIPPNPQGGKRPAVGLKAWLSDIKASGAKPVPEGDPVFAYAERVGIPSEFLALAWFGFKHRYLTQHPDKKYKDWRRTFRNAVESNWLKFWWVDGSGAYALTTAGQQAKKDFEARQHETR